MYRFLQESGFDIYITVFLINLKERKRKRQKIFRLIVIYYINSSAGFAIIASVFLSLFYAASEYVSKYEKICVRM